MISEFFIMEKFVVRIQGQTFSTKKSLKEKCKEILNSYKDGARLNLFDKEFMIDFFTQLAKSNKLKGLLDKTRGWNRNRYFIP